MIAGVNNQPAGGTVSCTIPGEGGNHGNHGQRGAEEPFPLTEKVNADRTPVEITSKAGRAFLVAADD